METRDGYQEALILSLLENLEEGNSIHYFFDGKCLTLTLEKLDVEKNSKPFPATVIESRGGFNKNNEEKD